MFTKEIWIVLCVILWNIDGRIGEDISECNVIDVNHEELERMNLKEQEEYVKKKNFGWRNCFVCLGEICIESI